MNILLIDSSARYAASDSRKLGEQLATRFGEISGSTMVRRDTNQGLHLLTEANLGAFFTPPDARTPEQNKLNQVSDMLIDELRACDCLILTIPMYNFNFPASLKMWFDLVMRENETFVTTQTGTDGLLKNKKAYVITTSGGTNQDSPNNLIEELTRLCLSTMGIEEQTYIYACNLAFDLENSLKVAQSQIDALEI